MNSQEQSKDNAALWADRAARAASNVIPWAGDMARAEQWARNSMKKSWLKRLVELVKRWSNPR
jgi:hypothetical protein